MPTNKPLAHVYQRTVQDHNAHDSLSIIASLIQPGQTLLDLGMGTGGLGQYLSQRFALIADGVTLNQAEAEIASKWYRHTHVTDLDTCDIGTLLAGEQYDCIVCADVLEHLKAPDRLLAQCKALLKPGGRLITSVPNAGYCGLIAELIQGEFRYRPEGLLDNTHLRFFTRQSLLRFFEEHGWEATSLQVIERALVESEFQLPFDHLPPAVARHLLALPDALAYQFVTVLQNTQNTSATPLDPGRVALLTPNGQIPAAATYSSQLFLGTENGYAEETKLVTSGTIGATRQLLQFVIAPRTGGYTGLRLDPADRPGFFKLKHLMLILPDGTVVWHWLAGQSDPALLSQSQHQQVLFQQPWELAEDVLLFLYGDDPWLQLPIPQQALQVAARQGARLEVCAGWPMSADFVQASTATRLAIDQLKNDHEQVLANLGDAYRKLDLEHQRLASERDRLLSTYNELDRKREQLSIAHQELNFQLAKTEERLVFLKHEKQAMAVELRGVRHDNLTRNNQIKSLQFHLQTIEQSTVFRMTRPIVNLKMKLDQLTRNQSDKAMGDMTLTTPTAALPPGYPVDIIVPVYRGLEDTRCCIESVLQSNCKTPWRLIVINDCSPEPELGQWLRDVAQADARIDLLENVENLGFVATVNRGMALSEANDVLLLNSDAEVANDWLDRIQRAAYSTPRVASVTPFSNNATICSYPRFCKASEMPAGTCTADLDRILAESLAGQTARIPTGVGFCMFIRRACLQEVGLFDLENFGKGYGEENDFCIRAESAGWTNLHALDTFVRHAGGVSFGDSKSEREIQAMATLNRLHPQYEASVLSFIEKDPAREARLTIDVARITGSDKPVILNVTHNGAGGTLRHIEELAQYLAGKAIFLRLSPAPKGVVLKLEGQMEGFELHFVLPQQFDDLVNSLRLLQVTHIHYHHLLGHMAAIASLPEVLDVSHDFTAHDYYSFCPQISLTGASDQYCGEEGLVQCHQCLQRNPAPDGLSIEVWRERHIPLLRTARFLLAPSQDTAARMKKYLPGTEVQVLPHVKLLPLEPNTPQPDPNQLSPTQTLKVAVLGALSKIKGADVLEAVAALAAEKRTPLEFHLIGYAYRNLRTQPKAKLTVHGAYEDQDLAQILAWLKPDLIWFPAVWPETYSYTLSACLGAGLPVVIPDLGAFAERVQNRPWTWLSPWQQNPSSWLAFFDAIRQDNFCTGQGPEPVQVRTNGAVKCPSEVDYYGNYLVDLPKAVPPSQHELVTQTKALGATQAVNGHPSTVIKSSALRAIIRLRATAALSPMAKLLPMHFQRRVKSWLRR